MSEILKDFGGRKFILTIIVILGLFILAGQGKISFEDLRISLSWILGIFVAGNSIQKLKCQ